MSVETPALDLKDRIDNIQRRIREAAERSGRAASAVRVVAATKLVEPARILEAARYGIREVGENRVQEFSAKHASLEDGPPLVYHYIGQLQTNKARRAAELFDVVQSVDRPRLAEALDRAARELGKRQRCLVEVKISDDAAKSGLAPADVEAFVADFGRYKNLSLEGLMGISPLTEDAALQRASFRRLAGIFERLRSRFGEQPTLSMGMTDDFELAVEEGATMVRIGRAIFGERST